MISQDDVVTKSPVPIDSVHSEIVGMSDDDSEPEDDTSATDERGTVEDVDHSHPHTDETFDSTGVHGRGKEHPDSADDTESADDRGEEDDPDEQDDRGEEDDTESADDTDEQDDRGGDAQSSEGHEASGEKTGKSAETGAAESEDGTP